MHVLDIHMVCTSLNGTKNYRHLHHQQQVMLNTLLWKWLLKDRGDQLISITWTCTLWANPRREQE